MMCYFKLLKSFKPCFSAIVARSFSSLYVTGDKGSYVYSVLVPYINFDERINHLPCLKHTLDERRADVNLEGLIELWGQYKHLKDVKMLLDSKKSNIGEQIKVMMRTEPSTQVIDRLKILGKFVRKDLKTVNAAIWNLEKKVILEILKLPNDLDPKTRAHEVEIEVFKSPKSNNLSHLDISKKLGIVEYSNPRTYFLLKEAAQFELSAMSYFTDAFLEKGFILFSNPDFSRSILMEGSGFYETDSPSLKLQGKSQEYQQTDSVYLNGGPSVFSYCAYHTKSVISVNDLPVRYVTKGRQYTNKSSEEGLYGVWQNSCVHIFIGCSESEVASELSKIITTLTQLYDSLEMPFRTIYASAKMLTPPEKLRVCFQVHSPFNKKYMDVGHVSIYGDFLSKRLRMYYSEKEDLSFLHLISGTVITIPPLLACSLENNGEHFIHSCLNSYMLN